VIVVSVLVVVEMALILQKGGVAVVIKVIDFTT